MTSDADNVCSVIKFNGGELVGRTRLQKTFYFLESVGAGFGFDFQYHHYGPFSEELSIAADDAIALKYISQEWKFRTNAQKYAVFRSLKECTSEANKKYDLCLGILNILKKYDAIVLELAATADFLSRTGFEHDPWAETIIRKSSKASHERVEKAKRLLSEVHSLAH